MISQPSDPSQAETKEGIQVVPDEFPPENNPMEQPNLNKPYI